MMRPASAVGLVALGIGVLLLPPSGQAQPLATSGIPSRAPAPSDLNSPYQPVADRTFVNQALPPGTLEIHILDADQKPLQGAPVTVEMMGSEAVSGQAPRQLDGQTDATGRHTFEGLKGGPRLTYRVTTRRGAAQFSSKPFNLSPMHGVTAQVHAYDGVTRLAQAALVIQAVLRLELDQRSIGVNHLIHVVNLGKTAYVATDLSVPLPPGYEAFAQEPSTSGAAMMEREGLAHLVGTFPPGQQDIRFSYQLPLSGTAEQRLQVPLPPRVARTRVMLGAGGGIGLKVNGFPDARPGRPHRGRPVMETAKEIALDGNLASFLSNSKAETLEITLSGLPASSWGRWLALALAALAVGAAGLHRMGALGGRDGDGQERQEELSVARDALIDELARLEAARRDGQVGPQSYQRVRTALLDAVARIVAQLEEAGCRGENIFPGWNDERSAATPSSKLGSSRRDAANFGGAHRSRRIGPG
jgi:hypothetical protein